MATDKPKVRGKPASGKSAVETEPARRAALTEPRPAADELFERLRALQFDWQRREYAKENEGARALADILGALLVATGRRGVFIKRKPGETQESWEERCRKINEGWDEWLTRTADGARRVLGRPAPRDRTARAIEWLQVCVTEWPFADSRTVGAILGALAQAGAVDEVAIARTAMFEGVEQALKDCESKLKRKWFDLTAEERANKLIAAGLRATGVAKTAKDAHNLLRPK